MERQLTELVTGLLADGWTVTVVARACDLEPHPLLRFVRVPGPYRPFAIGFPWFFFAAGWLTQRHRNGLLHVNGAIVPNRADVATVHFSHAGYHRLGQARQGSRSGLAHQINARIAGVLSRSAERWCYRPTRIPHLIGISDGVAKEVLTVYPYDARAATVIPYGVDRRTFRPDAEARERVRRDVTHLPDNDLWALFVGGDWGRKGLSFVVEALAAAPGWRLLVVGDGDEQSALSHARRHGVEGRVTFLGRRAAPADIYAAADAFCLPTLYETFCLVAHEAAAAGLPLLVSKVHGVDVLIEPGRNGWFIERDAADIAARLRELAASASRRTAMGSAARVSSSQYGWALAVRTHISLYQSLLGDAATPPEREGR
jgi:UDP-glucose:(heptosyl)LPS alpha-1,3-glucosyltransferase